MKSGCHVFKKHAGQIEKETSWIKSAHVFPRDLSREEGKWTVLIIAIFSRSEHATQLGDAGGLPYLTPVRICSRKTMLLCYATLYNQGRTNQSREAEECLGPHTPFSSTPASISAAPPSSTTSGTNSPSPTFFLPPSYMILLQPSLTL